MDTKTLVYFSCMISVVSAAQAQEASAVPETIPEKYQLLEKQAPKDRRLDLDALRQTGKKQNWTFNIGYTSAFQKNNLNALAGTQIPENFLALAIAQNAYAAKTNGAADLSAKLAGIAVPKYLEDCDPNKNAYNWRDNGRMTPVRNQGSCGACWAFSAAASYEIANSIRTKSNGIHLSEQAVLDCARGDNGERAGTCDGGWYYPAFQWMISAGVPPEKNDTYKEKDDACPAKLISTYKAVSWGFVSSANRIPLIKKIKQAICQYGPISSAIVATDAFSAYVNGLFNEPPNSDEDSVNHAVTIVGWNDNVNGLGSGGWLIKNSWGEDWGENGFGWVHYQTNKIGYAAAWVRPADAKAPVPQSVLQFAFDLSAPRIRNAELLINPDAEKVEVLPPSQKSKNSPPKKTIWVQFSTDASKEAADRVSAELGRLGYFAPGEDVSGKNIGVPSRAQVRYFDLAKKREAQRIAQLLSKDGYADVQVIMPKGYPKLSPLEVWLPNNAN